MPTCLRYFTAPETADGPASSAVVSSPAVSRPSSESKIAENARAASRG